MATTSNNLMNSLLSPFRYIAIGATTVLKLILNFFLYMCEGAYYTFNFIFIKPFGLIGNAFKNMSFSKSKPNVKDDKSLEISMNYDAEGKTIGVEPAQKKDIYSQMKANQTKAVSLKKARRAAPINEKQKERLSIERNSLLEMINKGQERRFEKPQTFRYKAMTPDGRMETSTFVGVSKLDIYTFLTGEGYTVFSIETSDWINFVYGQSLTITKKMSNKDLIFFITQLGTYIKSGITLTESMRILSKQLKRNRSQYRILQSIVYYLTMGESFSTALSKQVGAFPPLMINMIKAAEAAGNLDETLDDLGAYYEDINATRKQMISAISYPALVGVFSIVIIIFIMIKIVPQFVGIYASAGATLNPLTTFVIGFSNFLTKNIYIILLLALVAIFAIVTAYKNIKTFRRSMQVFMMKIPLFGKIIIYNELTIFTKTFASLLKNDVFITDSIEILSKITSNEIYKEIMLDTISNIARGEKISESFKNHWAIPDIAYYMIVTGENTGQLALMMAKVSQYYQEQHKTIINSLKAMIEPLLIMFLAVVVGGVLIAVIIPMFNLYSSIA